MNLQELLTPPGGYLVLGGILSFFVTLLHVFLAVRPRAWAYFGAGDLSVMAKEGSSFVLPVTIGLIGVLPLLRTLYIPSELVGLIKGTKPFHLVFVSLGALAAGLLCLFGVMGMR